jgi:hypothetical protein
VRHHSSHSEGGCSKCEITSELDSVFDPFLKVIVYVCVDVSAVCAGRIMERSNTRQKLYGLLDEVQVVEWIASCHRLGSIPILQVMNANTLPLFHADSIS